SSVLYFLHFIFSCFLFLRWFFVAFSFFIFFLPRCYALLSFSFFTFLFFHFVSFVPTFPTLGTFTSFGPSLFLYSLTISYFVLVIVSLLFLRCSFFDFHICPFVF